MSDQTNISEDPILHSVQDQQKKAAALAAVSLIKDGMVVGLGSGTTASFAISALGERIKSGLSIVGIPTSEATATLARQNYIILSTLEKHPEIDITIDGADEVEESSLDLIKGLGGALLREKIVASASKRFVVIVDATKLVSQLGNKAPLPVEVVQFGYSSTKLQLEKLGCTAVGRKTPPGSWFITDGGNYILDCSFGQIANPRQLSANIAQTVGVVESGLFTNLTSDVFVGTVDGIHHLRSNRLTT